MKIIDAHLHYEKDAYFDEIARAAHHENSEEHLRERYVQRGIVHGIVMGNRPVSEVACHYPEFLSYCVGIGDIEAFFAAPEASVKFVRRHLARRGCVGIKLYPGYQSFYIYDERLAPLYEIAAACGKPVAVHMGLTASEEALLKYSHPLVMDEAATRFRDVSFVMCHFGEPWFTDAAAVLEKNPNVTADLSGILEGKIMDFDAFLQEKRFYIERLKGWLAYLGRYDRFMFGTDWPLANLGDYIAFTKEIIPRAHWNQVFFENANRIYQLGL